MSDELQFYGDPAIQSGFTVTAKVYDDLGSQQGGDVSCTEVGSLAIYIGDMPTATAGTYGVRFFDSSNNLLAQTTIYWDGTNEVDLGTINVDVDLTQNILT